MRRRPHACFKGVTPTGGHALLLWIAAQGRHDRAFPENPGNALLPVLPGEQVAGSGDVDEALVNRTLRCGQETVLCLPETVAAQEWRDTSAHVSTPRRTLPHPQHCPGVPRAFPSQAS